MSEDLEALEKLRGRIIGCAVRVHSTLGPGLLESSYKRCLGIELRKEGLTFCHERKLDLVYAGEVLRNAYRIDLVVEDTVVVETKTVELVLPVHAAQVVTYLKLTGCPTGLIFNFYVHRLKEYGIRKVMRPDLYAAEKARTRSPF